MNAVDEQCDQLEVFLKALGDIFLQRKPDSRAFWGFLKNVTT